MVLSVAEIDELLSRSPGFRVVAQLAITESGVDPIGLRQLNLDLMDETVPGINNVTMHIRPYCFMTWAWWKARRVAEENGGIDPREIADLVARYETIYAWAHCLAEEPFRGAATIRAHLPLKGSGTPFAFEGPKWEEFKRRRTSFMAPTEYGPSIKALHFLKAEEGGTFRCSREAEHAVAAIDAVLASSIPPRLLARKPPVAKWEETEPLALQLSVETPSEAERDAFHFLFYGAGGMPRAHKDMRRRKATIDLLRAIMPEDGAAIAVPEIRRRLAADASNFTKSGQQSFEGEVRVSSLLLVVLQARQLQRLATESMMLWIERSL